MADLLDGIFGPQPSGPRPIDDLFGPEAVERDRMAGQAASALGSQPEPGLITTPDILAAPASRGQRTIGARRAAEQPLPEDSWSEVATKFVQNLPDRAKTWIGGLGQFTGELAEQNADSPILGSQWARDVVTAIDRRIAAAGKELSDEGRAELERNAPEFGESGANNPKRYAYEIANAFVDLGAAFAVTAATRNPTAGAAVMGGQVFGDQYDESRRKGRTNEQAFQDAAFMGATELVTERIPLGILMQSGGKFLTRVGKGAAAEAIQEAVTEVLQTGYDVGVLDEDMTWGEAVRQVIDAGIVGGAAGGGVAAVSAPFMREKAAEETPPPVELTPEDRASPIPDAVIATGKQVLQQAEANAPVDPEQAAAKVEAFTRDPTNNPAPSSQEAIAALDARRDDPIAQPSVAAPEVSATPPQQGAAAGTNRFDRMVQITLGSESGNRDFADDGSVLTSPAGAKGRMQVLDGTNTDPGFGVRPAQNDSLAERARVGRDYLAAMIKRYGGDPAKAWAAYNWGPGNLDAAIAEHGDEWLDHAPEETRKYVFKNLSELGEAGFDAETGEVAALPPEEVDAAVAQDETAEAFVARVLGQQEDAPVEVEREAAAAPETPQSETIAAPVSREAESTEATSEEGEEGVQGDGYSIRPERDGFQAFFGNKRIGGNGRVGNSIPVASREEAERRITSHRSLNAKPAEPTRRPGQRADGKINFSTWVANQGGLRDEIDAQKGSRHSLRKGRNLQRMIPGVGPLIHKNGRSPDELREVAVEAGWLPEGATEADFLEMLERDRFSPVYHPEHAAEVAEEESQRGQKSEDEARAEIDDALDAYAILATAEDRDRILSRMATGVDAETALFEHFEEAARETLSENETLAAEYDIPFAPTGDSDVNDFDPTAEAGGVPERPAGETRPGQAGGRPAAEQGPAAGTDPEQAGERPAPAAEEGPADSVTIEDMPSGKSVIIRGASAAQLDAVRAALPEKVQPLENKRLGGIVYSKKHEKKIRAALDGTPAPAARPQSKASKKGDTRLRDWAGVTVDGFASDPNDERGMRGSVKAEFLKDGRAYLKAVAEILAERGFAARPDRRGKPGKPVDVNEGGIAVSGDITLAMYRGDGAGVYVDIGTTLAGPNGGISLMARKADRDSDPLGAKSQNQWLPVDMTADQLADRLAAIAGEAAARQDRFNQANATTRQERAKRERAEAEDADFKRVWSSKPFKDTMKTLGEMPHRESPVAAAMVQGWNDGKAGKVDALRAEVERVLRGTGSMQPNGFNPRQGYVEAFYAAVTGTAREIRALGTGRVMAVDAALDQIENRDRPAPARPDGYGANNRLVTQDRAAELRERLKAKLSGAQLNSGLDPELIALGTELAVFHIEAGARRFADFAKAIADDLSMEMGQLRRYLRGWYNGARDMLEDAGEDVDGMDGPGAVRAALAMLEDAPMTQPESPARETLQAIFQRAFANGERFATITEARAFAARSTGRNYVAGTAEAKMLDEAIEAAVIRTARSFAAEIENPQALYARLVELYGQQPRLGVRTSTSVEQQAYSTPIPLAYLASRLAGIDQETTVYEPTAGNGALLIDTRATYAKINELNPDRAATLRRLFPGAEITTEDASEYRPADPVDAVIANPPFGAVRDDQGETVTFNVDGRYRTNEIDHAISMKALEAMKDNGRAVLIVGSVAKTARSDKARSDAYNGKAKREFYYTLYGAYNVVDHFTVAGELYERQGAGWPVDVIVIEGRGKAALPLPAVNPPRIYDAWDALSEVLNGRGQETARPSRDADGGDSRQGRESAAADERNPRRVGGGGDNRRGRVDQDGQSAGLRNGPVDGQSAGVRVGAEREGVVEAAPDRQSQRPSGRDQRPVETAENERQVAYTPGSGAPPMGTLVPINMQTAVDDALRELRERVGNIDDFVSDRLGYSQADLFARFGGEQVDAIGLAIDNIERGAGFIIGDQTGIGKGRVVAAVIRYAMRQNRAPIFVTEKPNLYKDMFRDMVDIGIPEMLGRDVEIMMTDAGKTVPLDDDGRRRLKTPAASAHNAALANLARSGLKDAGVDVLFTTYSQMQSIGGEETGRQRAIRQIASGGVLILDESHNAGGQGPQMFKPKKGEDGKPLAPSRAEFVRELVGLAHGVFYSSATYAKRPDVMDLYAATDMRLAVDDVSKLGDAIAKGGVPMQQIVAAMLSRAGQYLRRERSFDGIAYNTPQVEVDRRQYEAASAILKSIQTFSEGPVKEAAESLNEDLKGSAENVAFDGSTGGAGAASTNFTAIMHNVIDQMLLAFKAQDAADRAIAAISRGEKPVITVANTLEAFLTQIAEEDGVRIGQAIEVSFADVFRRYLERSRWVTVRKPFMKKGEKGERVRLTDQQLGLNGVRAFNEAMQMIDDAGLESLPGSPIDHIINRIEEAGYKVGEITGRTLGINYRNGKAYLKARGTADKSIKGRIDTITGFNDGRIDAMVLNQSGATGLSLHASEKFSDRRKRRMIIAQAERNIDTHMQMLGRIHRTGQVVLPEYDQLVAAIPAEKRPASVLAKKMASLNANTTASRDSAVTAKDVPDFMNVYGDEVAARVMEEEPDIHDALGRPLKEEDEGYERDGAMRKVTGRIPLLRLAQQEEIYQRLETEYAEYLANKEAAGENALEAKTLELDAQVESVEEAVPAKGSSASPFAAPVMVEQVNIKRLGKPYSSERVRQMVEEGKGEAPDLAAERTAGNVFRSAEVGKASDNAKSGVNKRLTDIIERWTDLTRLLKIGEGVKLKTDNGNLYGVVTGLARSGNPKNPLALGSWKATVALVDSSRQITLPLSQMVVDTGGASVAGRIMVERAAKIGDIPLIEAFDRMQVESRESRHIITGNILAGFDFMSSRGAIINFTDSEGQVRQGIIAPRGWDFERHKRSKGVSLTDHRAIVDYLTMSTGGLTGNGRSGDIILQLFPQRGEFIVTVSKSKKAGSEFFLNRDLTAALGTDFVSSSSGMVARAPAANAGPAIQVMMRSGTHFEVPGSAPEETKERAREVMQRYGGARFSRVEDSGPAAQGGRRPGRPFDDPNFDVAGNPVDRDFDPAEAARRGAGMFGAFRLADTGLTPGTVIELSQPNRFEGTGPVAMPKRQWRIREIDDLITILDPMAGNSSRPRDLPTRELVETLRSGQGLGRIVSQPPSQGRLLSRPEGFDFDTPQPERTMTQAQRAELEARQRQGMARRGGQQGLGDQEGGLFSSERDQGSLFSRSLDERVNEDFDSDWMRLKQRLGAQVKSLGLGDKIVVSVLDRIFNDSRIAGAYDFGIISVAMENPQAPEVTVDHEAIHALRDFGLFRPAEWTTLAKAAEADTALMDSVRRRYADQGLTDEQLVEEAVADMFAAWRNDRRGAGFIRSAFQRIADLFAAIRSLVTRTNTADDVMRLIERGRVGNRPATFEYVVPGPEGLTGLMPRWMVAWHGTPHEFDEFSVEKIGTGEGAIAFGWGLYFAGKREVAEFYRGKLSRRQPTEASWNGRTWLELKEDFNRRTSWDDEAWNAIEALSRVEADGSVDEALKTLRTIGSRAVPWLEAHASEIEIKAKGRLYEVEIPEEDEMLLWDKTTTEQPPKVRQALDRIREQLERADLLDEYMDRMNADWDDVAGGELVKMILPRMQYDDAFPVDVPAEVENALVEGQGRKASSLWLKSLGIAGTKYLDGGSRGRGDGSYNYVIFDDSRVSVRAKFSIPGLGPDAPKPNLSVVTALRSGINRLLGNGEDVGDRIDEWRTRLQDRMLPLLRTQQRIMREQGKPIAEAIDAYRAEELMSGKVGSRLEKLSDDLVTPLFDTMKADGVTVEELETFLYARHAPERNARIAEINPEFQEGTGSGMTDAEAAAIMERVEVEGKKEALERAAKKVDAILAFAVDTRIDAGLLAEEEAEAWRSTYQHYVPLRGIAEIEPESGQAERPRRGSGINVRGPESRRAFGRKSRADNILAYSLMQAEEAIIRAGTNEVGQAFYQLVKANPDPEFWTINKISRKPVFNKKTGQVSYRSENRIAADDAPYTVSLKVKGKERRVTMNRANPQAVRLAESMRNLNGVQMTGVMRVLSGINRFLSFVNTGLNPEFVITNAFRDLQTAGVNLKQFDRKGLVRGVLKDYPAALKGSIQGAFKRDKGEWGKWYREFVDNGGRVYFNRVEDLNELQRRIEREFATRSPGVSTARKGAAALFSFIENANIGVENAVRLSAYKNARERGMSASEAASLAKNLTVNFNRRGAWGVAMNSLYLFYNASVQGSVRMLQAMKSKSVRRVLYGAVMTGAALEMLNMMVSGVDDDDELYYDKISDFDKSRNLIVMIPGGEGRHIKIPLPYGYNSFFAIGRAGAEIARGRRWQESASALLTTIVDSFNPIGGTESLMNFIAPTVADPIVELERNRDFADRPIMPDQNQFGPPEPDNQRYWSSVSPHWRVITDFLNSASGGDEVVPGAVDISPETLEHLSGVVTGAAGTFFIDRIGGLIEKVATGEDVTMNDLPLARKIAGQKPVWYDKAAYYARVEEIEQANEFLKDYRERGALDEADRFEQENMDVLSMVPAMKRAKKALRRVRAERAQAELMRDQGEISAAEFRDMRREVEDQEDAILLDFNSEYLAMVEKPKRPD